MIIEFFDSIFLTQIPPFSHFKNNLEHIIQINNFFTSPLGWDLRETPPRLHYCLWTPCYYYWSSLLPYCLPHPAHSLTPLVLSFCLQELRYPPHSLHMSVVSPRWVSFVSIRTFFFFLVLAPCSSTGTMLLWLHLACLVIFFSPFLPAFPMPAPAWANSSC